jgi:dimeric dUTPase (all-alpha-NTP-PPase superfamily)
MSEDRLNNMFEQQRAFMRLLQEKRGFPEFPVDIKSKEGQKFLKSITHDCMGELFEANQHLKNSKGHRATEVTDIDRDAYVEELVDSLHFFFEIVILSGVSLDEIYEAYLNKGNINVSRINGGY